MFGGEGDGVAVELLLSEVEWKELQWICHKYAVEISSHWKGSEELALDIAESTEEQADV